MAKQSTTSKRSIGKQSFSFTNTKGQKVIKYASGEKTRSGGGLASEYEAAKLPKGITQVQKDGKVFNVRAGSSAETKAGLSPYQGIGVISSNQGRDMVTEADNLMKRFAPEPVQTPEQMQDAPAPEQQKQDPAQQNQGSAQQKPNNDFTTYTNPDTGQESTLRGDALNDSNKSNLTSQGYVPTSSDLSKGPENPEITRLTREAEMATANVNSYLSRLESSLIEDKELRADIRSIKQGYNARIQEMQNVNQRRQQAMEALGIRIGNRYTGGTGGYFGGILAEEERQGIMRIEQIESEKQGKIIEAKKEARNHNYNVYVKLMESARDLQDKKVTELAKLKEVQRKQDEKLAEESKQMEYSAAVVEVINDGVTNPLDIFAKLEGKVPFNVISDVVSLIPKPKEPKAPRAPELQNFGTADAPNWMQYNFATGGWESVRGLSSPNMNPTDTENREQKYTALLHDIATARRMSGSVGAGWIERNVKDAFSGNNQPAQLDTIANTIKANLLTLNTDPAIKKFFGPQMSNRDTELMMGAAGTLNPVTQSESEFLQDLTDASDLIIRARQAVSEQGGSGLQMSLAPQIITAPDGNQIEIID